jgi:hypothetical protein
MSAVGRRVVVPIAALDHRALAALGVARRAAGDRLVALHVATDPDVAERVGVRWMAAGFTERLVIVDPVGGDAGAAAVAGGVAAYVAAELDRGAPAVAVVAGRRPPPPRWRRLLARETAAAIAAALAAEPRVTCQIVTVPTHPARSIR